jgi:hypothetical protein
MKPFVEWPEEESAKKGPSKKEKIAERGAEVSAARFDYGVPVRINWPALLWVTIRDQVSLVYQIKSFRFK